MGEEDENLHPLLSDAQTKDSCIPNLCLPPHLTLIRHLWAQTLVSQVMLGETLQQ